MTILDIVKAFCRRTGLPVPPLLEGSTDTQAVQLLALANELLEDLADRHAWEIVQAETVLTTLAVESQGKMDMHCPGYRNIVADSMWNRTTRVQAAGPMTSQEWQAVKALTVGGGIASAFRIRGGELLLWPVPPAGQTLAFEYVSKYLASELINGVLVPKLEFTRDADEFRLPSGILSAGLRWKWKSEKGLDYAEEFRSYETLIANLTGRDGGKRTLNLGGGCGDDCNRPSVLVPAGNWMVQP